MLNTAPNILQQIQRTTWTGLKKGFSTSGINLRHAVFWQHKSTKNKLIAFLDT